MPTRPGTVSYSGQGQAVAPLQGSSVLGVTLLLLFNQGPVYEQLWRSAPEHHEQGRHQECVIFAQMAAEVAADASLTKLIARAEPVELRAHKSAVRWLFGSRSPGSHGKPAYEDTSKQLAVMLDPCRTSREPSSCSSTTHLAVSWCTPG